MEPAGAVSPATVRAGQCDDDFGHHRRYISVPDIPTVSRLCRSGCLHSSFWASATQWGITKEGLPELRTAMVEAAWVLVEHHPHWKGQFERLSRRIGTHKAIVAVAHKLSAPFLALDDK